MKYDAATKTYYLYSVDGLNWLSTESNTNSNQFSGYTVKLTSDVDMKNVAWTPIGTTKTFMGTFDGGNKTISNLTVKVTDDENSAGLFGNVIGNIKNVKLSNVNISGHYKAGAVVGSIYGNIENCHVDGGKILSTPNSQKNNANNVGGIVGYVSENSKTGYSVTNCTVNNLDITAYRSVGGIAGRLMTGAKVENCVVNNTNVIADMIAEYADTGKESAAGAVVGDNRPNADLSSNTTNNVTVNVYTVENGVATVGTADGLTAGLQQGFDVVLAVDVKINPAGMSNAYGTTGINVKNGQSIDGGGNTLDIKGAGGTWDSGINTTGGLIKNLTVTGSFRGIFINHNSTHSEQVVLDNVIIDGTTYTISCDQGTNQTLKATNSTFKGWTSYAATLGSAEFIGCYFGAGNGYAYCRPYAPTAFTNCEFEKGFQMDCRAACTFENCKLDGVLLTVENIATLVTSNTSNATVK